MCEFFRSFMRGGISSSLMITLVQFGHHGSWDDVIDGELVAFVGATQDGGCLAVPHLGEARRG